MRKLVRSQRGMTLIELLIVVAIIGVLSTIVIWNYRRALEVSKQKRTMSDIRAVAVAWEQYAIDHQSYFPAAAYSFPSPVLIPDLRNALQPTYIRHLPAVDAWNHPMEYGYETGDNGLGEAYAIRSLGRDGVVDPNYETTRTDDFDCDIVYSNGAFVVAPLLVN